MAEPDQDLMLEAAAWHLRIADGAESDWQDFTAWLEADPDHSRAYDRIEDADKELDGLIAALPSPPPPEDEIVSYSVRWRVLGGLAIAASLVLAALFGVAPLLSDTTYQLETAPGQTRQVQLAAGDRIELNGSTRLTLDHDDPRFAELEQGEATFTIVHHADSPFVVQARGSRIEDAGTVFNVVANDLGLRVAVAEGSVIYDPAGVAVTLAAGQSLTRAAGGFEVVVEQISPEYVGSWRDGRLSYSQAPLAQVAADLARSIGAPVTLDDALAGRTFSGTIATNSDHERLLDDVAGLLEVTVRKDGTGWRLSDLEPLAP